MLNKVILIGRVGQTPEIKYTLQGTAVCSFSIATSEKWKDKSGQSQEKTEWHNVVVWNKIAESCDKYLSKGSKVYIEGKIQTRSWDDDNGNKRYKTEIKADIVRFLDSKKDSSNNNNFDKVEQNFDQSFDVNDIPF